MRTNGTLKYAIDAEKMMNEFGEVIASETRWSEPIECSIKTNSDNRKGRYEDGVFRMASFTILIECTEFSSERISLERNGEQLGEYEIICKEPLCGVGRVKITV